MKTWFAILFFSGLTFLSLGIRPYIENPVLGIMLGSMHYLYLLIVFCCRTIKEKPLFKFFLFLLIVGHFTLDLFVFFEVKIIDDVFVIAINVCYIMLFYLCFIHLFKKNGSAFYNQKKSDWLVGFSTGLGSFLIVLLLFFGRVYPSYEPILILLGVFISLFHVLGVNTPLKTKNYQILILGLVLNFTTFIIAIYLFQIEPFPEGAALMKGLFMICIYCFLEALYEISNVVIRPRIT
ncbi:hypothetical protein [uncultured Arcticibacterium sp.]|uniref:hypothetical protein n=1 Tax=uncultured Arcticibacterium sp. TaxID=2173042 RepID=UPI0030F76F79